MSWESSAEYYRLLNQGVEKRLGGWHSAQLVMASVDLQQLTDLLSQERLGDIADILVTAARGVEAAGADLLLLCTTTFHLVADQVEAAVSVPMLHLADTVAEEAKRLGLSTVALIGTSFSMERPFFTDRLAGHGLEIVLPEPADQPEVNRIIYDELVHGKVLDRSRRTVVSLLDGLWDRGAQGVILGCTELELLIHQADSELPVLPCTTLHVEAALERALDG
jgi:aspartate racemase